tara:strand:- start:961 stop:1098 length:138 start_codon:yes stop_codon:yes gene_type:complete
MSQRSQVFATSGLRDVPASFGLEEKTAANIGADLMSCICLEKDHN